MCVFFPKQQMCLELSRCDFPICLFWEWHHHLPFWSQDVERGIRQNQKQVREISESVFIQQWIQAARRTRKSVTPASYTALIQPWAARVLILGILSELIDLPGWSCIHYQRWIEFLGPGSEGLFLDCHAAATLEWVAISFSNAWKWKMKVKSLNRVRLSDPMDCSLPGSSVHGIFQARVLEWGTIAFSKTVMLENYKMWVLLVRIMPCRKEAFWVFLLVKIYCSNDRNS